MSLSKQIVSFGIIGVINTVVDIGSYTALITAHVPLAAAIFLSTSLGLICSYTLNLRFTFEHQKATTRSAISFVTVTLFGLWIIQPAVIFGLTAIFSLDNTSELVMAKLLGTVVTMIWNFLWYKNRVFAPRY